MFDSFDFKFHYFQNQIKPHSGMAVMSIGTLLSTSASHRYAWSWACQRPTCECIRKEQEESWPWMRWTASHRSHLGRHFHFQKKAADVQFEVFIVFPQPYVLIEGLYCSLTFWDKACPMLSLLHWCVWGNVYHKTLALECKSPQP